MRYAYGITAALLLGGTALTLSTGVGAQVAQNEPGAISAAPPRAGAPMSFADLAARLQPAVVNISTEQRVPIARSRNPMEEMLRHLFRSVLALAPACKGVVYGFGINSFLLGLRAAIDLTKSTADAERPAPQPKSRSRRPARRRR